MISHRQLTAIDLFCGCGGLTTGLKQANYRVIGAVDLDGLAVETYRVNHKDVRVWCKDIRKLTPFIVLKRLGIERGELDLLAGCPPCQGYSRLRTLNGGVVVKDSRNNLVFDFVRFIREVYPKSVMMENVPGLAEDARMDGVIRDLRMMGYKCEVRVVDAADYGVPQRRRRMMLVANRVGRVVYAAVDSNRSSVHRSISALPDAGQSGDPLHDFPEHRTAKVMALIQDIPHDGGSRLSLGPERQLACHRGKSDGFKDIYGRMRWNDVAPTITSGCSNPSKGRFLHPELNRAITLREAALLQSFPVNYYFSLRKGKGAAAAMIGNALPPEFIRRHSDALRREIP